MRSGCGNDYDGDGPLGCRLWAVVGVLALEPPPPKVHRSYAEHELITMKILPKAARSSVNHTLMIKGYLIMLSRLKQYEGIMVGVSYQSLPV
jgi:hypothetical protein